RIDQTSGIPDPIVTLLIERGRRQVRASEVLAEDARALEPKLVVPAVRDELDRNPRQRQPDDARPIDRPMQQRRERACFGRTEPGRKDDTLAERVDREALQPIPN